MIRQNRGAGSENSKPTSVLPSLNLLIARRRNRLVLFINIYPNRNVLSRVCHNVTNSTLHETCVKQAIPRRKEWRRGQSKLKSLRIPVFTHNSILPFPGGATRSFGIANYMKDEKTRVLGLLCLGCNFLITVERDVDSVACCHGIV